MDKTLKWEVSEPKVEKLIKKNLLEIQKLIKNYLKMKVTNYILKLEKYYIKK